MASLSSCPLLRLLHDFAIFPISLNDMYIGKLWRPMVFASSVWFWKDYLGLTVKISSLRLGYCRLYCHCNSYQQHIFWVWSWRSDKILRWLACGNFDSSVGQLKELWSGLANLKECFVWKTRTHSNSAGLTEWWCNWVFETLQQAARIAPALVECLLQSLTLGSFPLHALPFISLQLGLPSPSALNAESTLNTSSNTQFQPSFKFWVPHTLVH